MKWRFLNYRFNPVDMPKAVEGKVQSFSAGLANTTEEIDLAPDGKMTAVRPDLRRVEANIRPQVEGIAHELTETLRSVSPPLPDRELQPGESWKWDSAPFEYPVNRFVSKGVFHLTNTYVGLRDRAGRREAIIEIVGNASPPAGKEATNFIAGRAIGAFAVDVQTGQVRLARVESDMNLEMEMPGPGGKLSKNKVGMVLDIRFQRGPTEGPPIPAVMPLPNGRIDFRPFVPGTDAKP